jgi:hypothetical protein
MSSQEKVGLEALEHVDSEKATGAAVTDAQAALDAFGYTPEEEKRILRHVDRRLVLTVGAMYCVSLMDRTNLGAANIAGMGKELLLIGNRYVSFFGCFFLRASVLFVCLISGWVCVADTRITEYHLAGLFRHLCSLPTTLDRHRAETRTPASFGRHHDPVGWLHDWDGLRQEMGPDGWAESSVGCA